ncbi:MAG: hypothetical protein ACLT9P_07835 [Evtepia gabavorous]
MDDQRLFVVAKALRRGCLRPRRSTRSPRWTSWFLDRFQDIVDMEDRPGQSRLDRRHCCVQAKEMGFSDAWIAALPARRRWTIKALRERYGIRPSLQDGGYLRGAEFEAPDPLLLLHL